ncbi:MAG: PSD1 and planctomycete cytochrome C domain-containing protein [Planctomycetaceae bacterium]
MAPNPVRVLWSCLAMLWLTVLLAAAPVKAVKKPVITPAASSPRLSKDAVDFFEAKIRPVLVEKCYRCHAGEASKAKGQLALDTRDAMLQGGASGEILSPGHPDKSLLIEAIKYEGLQMPPDGQLSEEQIADFEQWVEMGAPDPRFGKAARPNQKIDWGEARQYWAFQRPKKTPSPAVRNSDGPKADLDYFVLAKLEEEGLQPAGFADKRTLLRRVTFDLTGLPPTPEQQDAFLKDESSGAFTNVVDRLLASPQFGERWGRHWLDVARYAESSGKERNVPYRYAWRYRNYVIDAFNEDKPYNRFIVEQIAGDLLKVSSPAEHEKLIIATGFLAIGPKSLNTRNPEQFRVDVADDQIDVTGRAFLGLTISCARCHDHKFDPIPITDYYALSGVFQSTKTFAGVLPGGKTANERNLLAVALQDDLGSDVPAETDDQKSRRQEISRIESQLTELRKLKNQKSKLPQIQGNKKGKGSGKGKGKGTKPLQPAAAVRTAAGNPKPIQEQIKKLEDRLNELEQEPTPPGRFAMGVGDIETPKDAPVLNRGELKDKGQSVARGGLTILKTGGIAQISSKHSGRIEVANWIADKNNPLTARVMVNRIWSHLFGQGLVESVDNFGALGSEPSHPELLDALAIQFMEEKWSVKRLIRSMVLSRTYQSSGDHQAENYERDPENRYLWRISRRRLDAEEIRDAMLLASGQLEWERPPGSLVMNLSNRQIGNDQGMRELRKPSLVRSVYLPIVRGAVPEALGVFDLADPNLIVGKRDVTTVPTQALFLMNNPFVLNQAERMAQRVLEASKSDVDRLNLACVITLSRVPNEEERADLTKFLADYRHAWETGGERGNAQTAAWSSLCQLLFESGEFRYRY